MAVTNIEKHDSFGTWRDKTNEISVDLGDISTLVTPTTTSVVAALNSIVTYSDDNARRAVIIGIALS